MGPQGYSRYTDYTNGIDVVASFGISVVKVGYLKKRGMYVCAFRKG